MPPLISDEASDHEDLICDPSSCSDDCGTASSAGKKRIFFNCNVQALPIATLDDFTPEEVNACWYSAEEKGLMWDSHEETVRRMESGKRPKKNTSYRGLENWCKNNSSLLDNAVHACIDAVMDEQDRQWKVPNTVQWGRFREVSLKTSRASASLAYRLATHDESEAGKAYISMAKKEYKVKKKQGRRHSLGGASVSSELTEVTNSTMVHEIRNKHQTKSLNPVRRLGRRGSSESSKKPKAKKSKRRSSKHPTGESPKSARDASCSMKKKLMEREARTKLVLAA